MDSNKILELIRNVPCGNSAFQNQKFVSGEETDTRKYRTILLQMKKKIDALKNYQFSHRKYKIEREMMQNKIKAMVFPWQRNKRKLLQIELDKNEWEMATVSNLVEDAMIEVNTYENLLSQLPEFNREQFENGEQVYWETRLIEDSKREQLQYKSIDKGTNKALNQIGVGLSSNNGQINYIFNKDNDNVKKLLGLNEQKE